MLKHHKIIRFAVFIVTLFCSLKTGVAAQMQKVYGNYIFVFEASDSILVHKLMLKIKPSLEELDIFFGKQTGSVITIYLTPSQEEYRKRTRNVVPAWSQAVAFPQQRLIVLRIASAEEIKTVPQTLLHELVHVHVAQIIPSARIPVWLNEGLAQYLSHKELTVQDKVLLANNLALKKILQLGALDTLHSFGAHKARLAYVQSLSAVHYYIRIHGRESLQKLLYNLALYHSVNDAFKATVGYDFIDFELKWYEDLKQKYRWLVVLNLDNLLWVIMGLLALLAIFVVRRRNQKKIRTWEQDETDQV